MSYEGTQVLNYKLTKKLGEGGFGAVYLAEHTELGRQAAIKILHHQFATQPQMVERFFQEARAVCAINHRAIIAIENFGRLPGTDEPFYLMEFFAGGSLTQISSERWLTSEQLIAILDPIADALTAAHDKGIIHRDLKPDNVMVRIANERVVDVRLLDFGIAKLLDGQSHSMTGSAMGTPAFMPPEQALDAKHVDVRADVYAFGATVYAAVAGRPPFVGSSVAAILIQAQTDTAPLLSSIRPDVPAALDAAIRRCLAKQREHRPSSIADAWQAIRPELVQAHLSSGAVPTNPAHPTQTPSPIAVETPVTVASPELATSPEVRARSRVPWMLGGVGAIATLGIVIAVASSGSQPTAPVATIPDAAQVPVADAAAPASPPDGPAEMKLALAEIVEPVSQAATRSLTVCAAKGPSSRKVSVLYRIDVRPDGTLGKVGIDGVTTPAAECVRAALENQQLGIRATREGGSFAVPLEMPDAKTAPIPGASEGECVASRFERFAQGTPPRNEVLVWIKKIDLCAAHLDAPTRDRLRALLRGKLSERPKPADGCDTLLLGALRASGDAEVRAMLERLEACRGKLDAATFTRIQQTLISK